MTLCRVVNLLRLFVLETQLLKGYACVSYWIQMCFLVWFTVTKYLGNTFFFSNHLYRVPDTCIVCLTDFKSQVKPCRGVRVHWYVCTYVAGCCAVCCSMLPCGTCPLISSAWSKCANGNGIVFRSCMWHGSFMYATERIPYATHVFIRSVCDLCCFSMRHGFTNSTTMTLYVWDVCLYSVSSMQHAMFQCAQIGPNHQNYTKFLFHSNLTNSICCHRYPPQSPHRLVSSASHVRTNHHLNITNSLRHFNSLILLADVPF